MEIIKIFNESNVWNAIAAISGLIAAVVALFTVRLSIVNMKSDRESHRPYFVIEKPGIKELPNSPPFRIQITFINSGKNPAKDFSSDIYIFDDSLKEKPIFSTKFTISNEIPNNNPTPYYNDSLRLADKVPKMYIFIGIKYFDPILEKHYNQYFYMKWGGVENGKTHPDFCHANLEEKDSIIKYIITKNIYPDNTPN